MRNVQYTAEEMGNIKKDYPRRFAGRNSKYGFDGSTLRCSSEDNRGQREDFYEELWQQGRLAFWFANYADTLTDPTANIRAYNFWRRKVRQCIHDHETAELLAPIKPPHALGTKRPSLETSYSEVFH